jgi:hypothetical protein
MRNTHSSLLMLPDLIALRLFYDEGGNNSNNNGINRNSWVDERLMASEEGFSPMDLGMIPLGI